MLRLLLGCCPISPKPVRAAPPLTTGVEDDLQVPVVAVGLSQGDTGGGGRAGPGVGICSQGMGRALQPCGGEEGEEKGQPLAPPRLISPPRLHACARPCTVAVAAPCQL